MKGGERVNQLILKAILILICLIGGYIISDHIGNTEEIPWTPYLGAFLGLILSVIILEVEKQIKKAPLRRSLGGVTGLVLGLVVARLLMFPFDFFRNDVFLHYLILVFLSGIFGYLGLTLGSNKAEGIGKLANSALFPSPLSKNLSRYLLDTSVIIDGRIADICETGFVEGTLIIPQFILQELHHIADSSDSLKKIRGRRGLDVIEKIQKQKDQEVIILDQNPPKDNVDAKLVDLALELNGTIITNDFNLNKVAELRGVKCLNLNKLANALKPAVLSGEVLTVQIIREGKTPGQGIAYMDDGTMVVVENARRHIGKTIEVVVTSVLQTGTGRMIFTEIKNG
ncbi:MAG: twitching motility protein PilT [Deltaproteobacteria bacterium RBG_13_43_22]|nr:MAG: twitching motility protein PilT [Deltaproteobacteria bacterium RBG_13_43_22]